MGQQRYEIDPNRVSAGGRTDTTDDRRRDDGSGKTLGPLLLFPLLLSLFRV